MALPLLFIGGGILAGAHVANRAARDSQKKQEKFDGVRPTTVPRDIREIVQTPEFLRGELRHKGSQLWAGGKWLHEYQDPVNKQKIYAITDRKDPYFGHGEGYL